MHTEDALPPPVDHRGCAGVRESRGLPVSCVHAGGGGAALYGEDALTEALVQRICAHYAAAFKLLPVAEHPELITCLDSGGAPCLGLLEPRSNIVANAVINRRSYLDQHRRRRRRNVAGGGGDKDDDGPTRWLVPARRYLSALTCYLRHYFRYLSKTQALGYLYLADADLVAAMGLVETDLAAGGRSRFTFHAPSAERAGGALYAATVATNHPAVSFLVHRSFDAAMAGRFQPDLGKRPIDAASLHDAAFFLRGDRDDDDYYGYAANVRRRCRKGERPPPPPPPITLYGLRRRKYGADRIAPPPLLAGVRMPRPPEGKEEEAPCAYEETLRKILLDALHICYLQAFARLAGPAAAAAMHIPIVRSGLCFGPMDDPVDNILVNAVWFKTAFPSQSPSPAPAPAGGQPPPPLQLVYNERIAALCARSLDAAVAYLRTRFPELSRHDATLLLYRAGGGGCDVARAGELAELAGHAPSGESRAAAVRAAVSAAGHPEEARMANFVHVLSAEAKERVLARLRRPRPGPLLGIGDLDEIAMALAMDFYFPLDDGILPEEKPADHVLSAEARILLESRTAFYEDQQQRIMGELDAMLNKENKEVLCVFGTTRSHGKLGNEFFHVNFLARDVNEDHWDLFFAQILYIRREVLTWGIPYVEGAKSVFFPLLWSAKLDTSMSRIQGADLSALAMSAGRCSYCEGRRSKIFHPNYGKPYRGIHASVHDEQCDHKENLESDYVYFNDQTDIRLIKWLNATVYGIIFACLKCSNVRVL